MSSGFRATGATPTSGAFTVRIVVFFFFLGGGWYILQFYIYGDTVTDCYKTLQYP